MVLWLERFDFLVGLAREASVSARRLEPRDAFEPWESLWDEPASPDEAPSSERRLRSIGSA